MNPLYRDAVLGIVRHVAGAAGAILVTKGVIDPAGVGTFVESIEIIAGSVMTVGAVVASLWAKRK